MVSPIAYDLSLLVTPSQGLSVDKTYGFPGEPTAEEARMEVSTVFLSRRRGALLVQLAPGHNMNLAGSGARASLILSYVGQSGQPAAQTLTVSYTGQPLDDSGTYMPQTGIAKTVALALLVTGMRDAATAYQSDHAQAIAVAVQPGFQCPAQAGEHRDQVAAVHDLSLWRWCMWWMWGEYI